MLVGFERTVGGVQLGLPRAEVRLLGQLARGAQAIEYGGIGRLLVEELGGKTPQPPVGGVVEGEPLVGGEDRDRGRQLVERAPVRLHHAGHLGAHGFDLGGVDADPGAAAVGRQIENVEDAPRAGDDHRQSRGEGLALRMGTLEALATVAVEKVDVARDRIGCVLGLDRDRVGRIHEGETAVGVARPDGRWQRLDQRARGVDLAQEVVVARGEIDVLALDAAHVLDAQDGAPADRPTVRFDETAVQCWHGHGEALASSAKLLDLLLHRAGALRVEPGAEREHPARYRRRRQDRGIADDLGLLARRRPRDDDLRLGQQQRVGAIGLVAQRDDLGARRGLALAGARARAHQRNRGDDRKKHDAEGESEGGNLVALERREGGYDGGKKRTRRGFGRQCRSA